MGALETHARPVVPVVGWGALEYASSAASLPQSSGATSGLVGISSTPASPSSASRCARKRARKRIWRRRRARRRGGAQEDEPAVVPYGLEARAAGQSSAGGNPDAPAGPALQVPHRPAPGRPPRPPVRPPRPAARVTTTSR